MVGDTYSFTPSGAAPSGTAVSYLVSNLPAWASFSAATGEISGTPTSQDRGVYANIDISINDGATKVVMPPFTITVVAPLSIGGTPPATAVVGSEYEFQPATSAAPGTALKYSGQNLPAWATLDPSSGGLSGTPNATGTFSDITISVTDGVQVSTLAAFSITVNGSAAANSPPSISGQPAAGVLVGSVYSFTPKASDPNGRALSFSVANLPAWASFNTRNGQLTGAPSLAQVGTYASVVISVSNGSQSASLAAFTIRVVQPLTISGSPATQVASGESYGFQPQSDAPKGVTLTFTIKNRPSWASFSSATGTLSGAPQAVQGGTYSGIVISVSDGVQTVSLPAFTIHVLAPLAIGGAPASQVIAGQNYSFQPTTNAPSGTSLAFKIANKPAWASFNTATGTLTGVPAAGQVGTYTNISISVTNGSETSTLAPFAIAVTNPPAQPPVIAGSPSGSVSVGGNYRFTPSATGPAGRTLTFSIKNQPSWASFDASTGALTGTPAASGVGTYSDIVISVSDGVASAALAAFSITVTAAPTGTATLKWTAVTENTNGTTLTNLAGYKIYYGTSATNLNNVVTVANTSTTSYQITGLAAGNWYFAMSAYTSSGAQGEMSNVGSLSVD